MLVRRLASVRLSHVKGALTYYADPAVEGRAPATSRMDAFPDGGPACAGYLPLDCTCLPEKVRVVYGPRPAALQFLPGNRVHVMDRMSDPSNYAHLLLDTVISAYAAVQIYGDRPQDLQPLFLNDCQTFTDQPQHKHYRKGGEYYLLPPRMQTANELCAEKTAQWLPLAFTHEPLYPPHGDACFREVIVGHAHALSVGTMFPHRGVAVRALRRHVRRQLGLPARVDIKQHKVIVLVKTNVIRPAIDFDSCAALRNIMARDPDAPAAKVLVECIRPASMSIKEQLTAIEDATLVVSEHGSTSYISFFQTPKTSLIILGDKEAMALLSHVDVQTWFHPRSYLTSSPEWGRLPGLVMLALDRAGRKLGLERL